MIKFRKADSFQVLPGIVHAFTTRHGGVSEAPYATLNLSRSTGDRLESVSENRRRVLTSLGRADASWVSVKQVHGADIVQVTAAAGSTIEADGLWTSDHKAALAVVVADCVPLLFADREGRAIGAVHAGWRGTQAKIAGAFVERWIKANIELESIRVAIGPAIGPEAFEVGPEVADVLRESFPDDADAFNSGVGDRVHVDLWALNRRALLDVGVQSSSIEILRECTATSGDFFSYRGDGGVTGRQGAIIALAR